MKNKFKYLLILTLVFSFLTGCSIEDNGLIMDDNLPAVKAEEVIIETKEILEDNFSLVEYDYEDTGFEDLNIGKFEGNPYVEVNSNIPFFSEEDYTLEPFEIYSELDEFGRCGETFANICIDIMPTEERGEIGHIKPSGWHTVKYDIVDGKYLYNRCHLIGFQLAGENDNEQNLITGTRYLNIDGMLDHENMIDDYVEETGNHVLYRVTPLYEDDDLLAKGVLMEAYSVEDKGEGIQFNIFAYNVQPGIKIDYATGESFLIGANIEEATTEKEYKANEEGIIYILNTNSKKYHLDTCGSVEKISEENKETFNGTTEWLLDNDYEPCGICKP